MSQLLDRLRKHKDDRGLMANLRCILVDSKRHRAWPALHRLGVRIDDDLRPYVAALYATHPEETPNGNFGTTCKAIELKRHDRSNDESRLTPTERRFQQLLTAERGKELYDRVLRMVLMAKSQEIPVNYVRLETDLRFWGDRVRTEWAATYWAQSAGPVPEEGT
ncbi:MAG: type I-E CRISPR-associated protein Cse2/CasB [bacterium]